MPVTLYTWTLRSTGTLWAACGSLGTVSETYEWKISTGTSWSTAFSGPFSLSGNTLTINSSTPSDAGVYYVK